MAHLARQDGDGDEGECWRCMVRLGRGLQRAGLMKLSRGSVANVKEMKMPWWPGERKHLM